MESSIYNKIELEFKNYKFIVADLVIVADGGNSKIRPYITSIKSQYTGYFLVEGSVEKFKHKIPKIHNLMQGCKMAVLGSEKLIVINLKGDGSALFYAGHKSAENWHLESGIDFSNKLSVLEWFKSDFTDWHPMFSELFNNANTRFVPRPQYAMPFDQEWPSKENLTLIGDAAHVMPPYGAAGVNMAMMDALELSDSLNKYATIQEAIQEYETSIRKRNSPEIQRTLKFAGAFHSKDAVGFLKKFKQIMF